MNGAGAKFYFTTVQLRHPTNVDEGIHEAHLASTRLL